MYSTSNLVNVTRSEKKALQAQFIKIELSLSFDRAIFDLPNATYSKLISHSYQELYNDGLKNVTSKTKYWEKRI